MSKGPGCWQRAILAALDEHGAVYMCDLLPTKPTRAQRTALDRAARMLHASGRIDIWQGGFRRSRLVLVRPGFTTVVGWWNTPRLKRCTGPEAEPVQHLDIADIKVEPVVSDDRFNQAGLASDSPSHRPTAAL